MVRFGALKKLNHCKVKAALLAYIASRAVSRRRRLILTDLCKRDADNALDADQRPGKPEPLLFVSMTVITPGAAKEKEPEMQAAEGSGSRSGFVLKAWASLLVSELGKALSLSHERP